MANAFLAVKFDKAGLLRLLVQVQAVGAKLLLNLLRNFKADVYVAYLSFLVSGVAALTWTSRVRQMPEALAGNWPAQIDLHQVEQ